MHLHIFTEWKHQVLTAILVMNTSKKRKRDVRQTQKKNVQRAHKGKARQASLESVDVGDEILKDFAVERP